MVEGIVTEAEPDHVRIRSQEMGTDIYVDHGVDCAPDQRLWWAIRPEKIALSRDKPAPQTGIPADANVVKGYVEDIAYLGDMTVYQVKLENGRYIIGYISRRDIADEIRALANPGPLPDEKTLKEFDDYMRGVEPPDFGGP